jgi:hypothetical protein
MFAKKPKGKSKSKGKSKTKSKDKKMPDEQGFFSKAGGFFRENAKILGDVAIFAVGVGVIYAFGEQLGNYFTKQLPTEESIKEYYNELRAESSAPPM